MIQEHFKCFYSRVISRLSDFICLFFVCDSLALLIELHGDFVLVCSVCISAN